MRIVIMGCGRVGGTLANQLSAEGHTVSIIDINPTAFEKYLAADFSGHTILGNGIDEDVLREAGIEQAGVFIGCTTGDNHNLMAAQIAKVMFGVKRVVARCNDQLRSDIYGDLGLVAVSPSTIVAGAIREAMLNESLHQKDVGAAVTRLLIDDYDPTAGHAAGH